MKDLIKIRLIVIISIITFSNVGHAQQMPLHSHYFLQEHIINPAYTGSRPYNPVYVGYRNQWSDFEGSPETFTLGGHYAIDAKQGIGGGFFKDILGGAYSQVGGQLNYAYHIQIKEKGFLSLGAGAIFNQFSGDYSKLDPNDPALLIGTESKLATDFSLGVQYSANGLRLGLSTNNLTEASISDYGVVSEDNRLKRQVHLMGSYRVDLGSAFALEPMLLLRSIGATPTQVDATLLAHIKQLVSVGLTYRTGDALAFICGLQYKSYMLYYSFDMTISNAQNYTGQTHEITLGIRMPGKGGKVSGDKDGDGVRDSDDPCPTVAGPKANNGCPYGDSDGDGVPDNKDKCPQLAGKVELRGCPDRDNDGIADLQDECPDIPGSIKNGGCPEFSQLHIIDSRGKTVTIVNEDKGGQFIVRGIPHNNQYYFLLESRKEDVPNPIYITIINGEGEHKFEAILGKSGYYEIQDQKSGAEVIEEPKRKEVMLKSKEKEVVDQAFNSLEFETGKAIIKDVSYPSLLQLVKLLDANKSYRLWLVGHTDNVGSSMTNLMLSKKRADAVRHFLVQFGIDENRFIVSFEGENKPIADNETEEGKQKNRRVEMKVIK